jgi:hypothetical protein
MNVMKHRDFEGSFEQIIRFHLGERRPHSSLVIGNDVRTTRTISAKEGNVRSLELLAEGEALCHECKISTQIPFF